MRQRRRSPQAQKASIQDQLEQMKPLVKNVFFESKQQAYDRFKQQFRTARSPATSEPADMPESFRVS